MTAPTDNGTGALSEADFIDPIQAIFADVLHLPEPDPEADFFELGGDSLLLLQVVLRAREQWGADLDIAFLQAPPISVRSLARAVASLHNGHGVSTTEE